MSQVYLDLVDGFHLKVKPLRREKFTLVNREYQTVLVRVEEDAHGFRKGEELQRAKHYLFCIAGHSSATGKIKAVAPDLSHLEES